MENKNHLVSFGDSWAQGSELAPDEKTFGELLSQQLGCEKFSNYSNPASSISHLVVQLKSFLKMLKDTGKDPSTCIAVFFLTAQERSMSWLDDNWIFQTANGGYSVNGRNRELVDDINNHYWKYFYSNELATVETNTVLIALQSICKQYNITDYYLPGWQKFELWDEVDQQRVFTSSCGELIDIKFNDYGHAHPNPYVSPNISHPNQLGHQHIAKCVFDWITDAR